MDRQSKRKRNVCSVCELLIDVLLISPKDFSDQRNSLTHKLLSIKSPIKVEVSTLSSLVITPIR